MTEEARKDIKPWNWGWLDRRANYLTFITPELATELLERNTNNRAPRPKKIEQFVRDMKRDHWDPDASDLKFAMDGTLLDGQNRLMACQEAGVGFATLVRTGLDKSTQSKVDTGTARTASDALKMVGVSYGGAISAAVALRMRFDIRYRDHNRQRGRESRPVVPTHDEILEWLAAHPMTEKYAGTANTLCQTVVPAIARSVGTAAVGWFAEINAEDTDKFLHSLMQGEWGGPGDPLMAFVAYAARARGNTRGRGAPGVRGRTVQEEQLMAMIKTWNAWRTNEPVKLLSIKSAELLELPC